MSLCFITSETPLGPDDLMQGSGLHVFSQSPLVMQAEGRGSAQEGLLARECLVGTAGWWLISGELQGGQLRNVLCINWDPFGCKNTE